MFSTDVTTPLYSQSGKGGLPCGRLLDSNANTMLKQAPFDKIPLKKCLFNANIIGYEKLRILHTSQRNGLRAMALLLSSLNT